MTTRQKSLKNADVEIALLYKQLNPKLQRHWIGRLLEKDGLGTNHHLFSGCESRQDYINLILDYVFQEGSFELGLDRHATITRKTEP